MPRHLRRLILTAIIVMCSAIAASAQSSIEKIVTKLEDNPKCETTTYREYRDPKTHKIIAFEMIVTFNDDAIAERIINAFKNERKNAISYMANNNWKNSRTSKLYMIEFHNNGSYSKYTLSYTHAKRKTTTTTSKGTTVTSEDLWTLIVKSSDGDDGDNKSRQYKKSSVKRTKTSIKRSKSTLRNNSFAIVPEELEIDVDVDIDPAFLADIIQSSIDIPTSSDFKD